MAHFSFEEYKRNTKGLLLEEPFDFLVFRPIAYFLVKSTYWLPLTPDYFSVFGLIASLLSGYFLFTDGSSRYSDAGILIILFSVFDCCDGMLARLKKNGSKYGALIDMFIDLISSSVIYISLFWGLRKNYAGSLWPFLVFVCAFFLLLQTSIYNYYKKQYFYYLDKNPFGLNTEIEFYSVEYQKLKNISGYSFVKMLLKLYLTFTDIQQRMSKKQKFDIDRFIILNKRMILFWGVGSGSTHLFILAMSLIFNQLWIYFIFAIFISNIALIYINFLQIKINKKLVVKQQILQI